LRGWNSCRIRMPSFEFSARMLPVLPEFSLGSSSVHLETCTGSVIHTLPRLSFVIRHSTSRSSSLGSEPATDWTAEEPFFDSRQKGTTKYAIQWATGDLFPGSKRLWRTNDHPPPSNAEVRNTFDHPPSPWHVQEQPSFRSSAIQCYIIDTAEQSWLNNSHTLQLA
jgi:hypothetical protein